MRLDVQDSTLYLGDCLEVMKTMPPDSVDSIVTDPPYGLSFMGKAWDYDVPSIEIWNEALRILKPGGHMLSFGGARTYHRMTVAIEDAGFEIRDQIMWLYGSGFPKSRNLSGEWEGWGTALKPAHEPICVARKPLEGTVAENVSTHGTGAINIDACRVEVLDAAYDRNCSGDRGHAGTRCADQDAFGSTNLRAGGGSAASGRFPANVIHDGSPEVLDHFPDASGAKAQVTGREPTANGFSGAVKYSGMVQRQPSRAPRIELETSAARFFYCAKASRADRNDGLPDPGPQFKHGSTLRDAENLAQTRQGNHHPTVKPTELMLYLCRLVTPSGGVVLDPFMGSGSTGKAAMRGGFRFTGIERDPHYFEIARVRVQNERSVHLQLDLVA